MTRQVRQVWPQAGAAPTLAVTVTLVVTVDVDAWRRDYGDDTRAEIADSVKRSAVDAMTTIAPDAIIDVRKPYRRR